MNAICPSCGKDLEGEPGYFFGAMYVSYAFAVALGIIVFLTMKLLMNIKSLELIIAVIFLSIFLTAYLNFRISRIIWLNIFPPGKGTSFRAGKN